MHLLHKALFVVPICAGLTWITQAQVPSPANTFQPTGTPVSAYLKARPELKTFLYPNAAGGLGGAQLFGSKSTTNWQYRTPDSFEKVAAFYVERCAPSLPLQGEPQGWFSSEPTSQIRHDGMTKTYKDSVGGFDNEITARVSRTTMYHRTRKHMISVFLSRAQGESFTDISIVVTDS